MLQKKLKMIKRQERENNNAAVSKAASVLKSLSSDLKPVKNVEDFKLNVLKSGNYALDWCLGCGGLPQSRIVELFGEPSTGKTTLAQMFVANVQKAGGVAAWIDAEGVFEFKHAKKLGINPEELLFCRPTSGEKGLTEVINAISSKKIDLVVVDSVAALLPKVSKLRSLEDNEQPARLAALMSRGIQKINQELVSNNKLPCVVFINQVRAKIGVMFGDNTDTTGGKALKFFASVRMKTLSSKKLVDEETGLVRGVSVSISNTKNKVGMPFRHIVIDVDYTNGVDRSSGLLDVLVKQKIVQQDGRSFVFGEHRFMKKKFRQFFVENRKEILGLLYGKL